MSDRSDVTLRGNICSPEPNGIDMPAHMQRDNLINADKLSDIVENRTARSDEVADENVHLRQIIESLRDEAQVRHMKNMRIVLEHDQIVDAMADEIDSLQVQAHRLETAIGQSQHTEDAALFAAKEARIELNERESEVSHFQHMLTEREAC